MRDPQHGSGRHEEAAVGEGEVAVGDADLARADGRVHAEGLCFFVFVFGVGERGERREREGKKVSFFSFSSLSTSTKKIEKKN